jgi:hypothetical protein
MNTKAHIFALAFTIASGFVVGAITSTAIAEGFKPQLASHSNTYAMRMDRCPYYPSPVFCRGVRATEWTAEG